MSAPLDEVVVQHVEELGSTKWSGTAYRYTSVGRDPLSGEGARRLGGRWNPRGIFPTVYLAQPQETSAAELERLAAAAGTTVQSLLTRGYEIHGVTVTDLAVLDLRGISALAAVGLDLDDITDADWSACQTVGHAAWFLEMQGVIAPSASGTGVVVAAFETRLRAGQLARTSTTVLDETTYAALRAGSGP